MSVPEIRIKIENHGDSAIARVENAIFPRQLTPEEASQLKVKYIQSK